MTVRCPRCGKETPYEGNSFRPFCSARCKTIDLGSWASGTYRVPVETPPDESAGGEQDETSDKPEEP